MAVALDSRDKPSAWRVNARRQCRSSVSIIAWALIRGRSLRQDLSWYKRIHGMAVADHSLIARSTMLLLNPASPEAGLKSDR